MSTPQLTKKELQQSLAPYAGDDALGRCLTILNHGDENDCGESLPTGRTRAMILRETLGLKFAAARDRGVVALQGDDQLLLAMSDLDDDEAVIAVQVNPGEPYVALYLRESTNEPLGCVIVDRVPPAAVD